MSSNALHRSFGPYYREWISPYDFQVHNSTPRLLNIFLLCEIVAVRYPDGHHAPIDGNHNANRNALKIKVLTGNSITRSREFAKFRNHGLGLVREGYLNRGRWKGS